MEGCGTAGEALQEGQDSGAEHQQHLHLSPPCRRHCSQTLKSPSPPLSSLSFVSVLVEKRKGAACAAGLCKRLGLSE